VVEVKRFGLRLLVILISLSFFSFSSIAEEPPYSIEIEPTIREPEVDLGAFFLEVFFEHNCTVYWSFESDIPIRLEISRFAKIWYHNLIEKVDNTKNAEGKIKIDTMGRHQFTFVNEDTEQFAHVTFDYSYTPPDENDDNWQQITWVGVILSVVILSVVIFVVFSKKKKASSPVQLRSEVQLKECPSCGSFNPYNTQFCEYCAKQL
jgi:hypothetical protein